MEAYTRWEASAPWSVLAKSGLLSERERLPTVSLVFVLRPRGYKPQRGNFRLAVGRKPTQQVWFREICLWRVKPAANWRQWPAILPLYPLCSHKQHGEHGILVPATAIAQEVRDPVLQADLLTTLAIFSKLAYPGLNVLHMIGREKMKESTFFDEVAEEITLETRRDDVLRIATIRFGPEVRASLEEKLSKVDISAPLAGLIEVAVKCRSVVELHRQLDAILAERAASRKRRRSRTN
jgi:hypothetical protein